ncbi:ribonuclease H-like domain-containing protein [Irpex lacteus]|nr:ribonuclease H-like domain-containing protein [Irpex lacteus]
MLRAGLRILSSRPPLSLSQRRYTTPLKSKSISRTTCTVRMHSTSTQTMKPQPLDFNAGPLVWVDCEMTGLNPQKDKIIEIAVLITNGKLELVDEGIQFVINTEKEVLDGMDEWCTNQHGKTGLTQACLTSPHSTSYVSAAVLQYIKKWIPDQRVGVLAGSSVHADRSFLVEEMPEVVEWLHYRIVDVSSIKELCRRWFPTRVQPRPENFEVSHRALDEIRGSIRELEWYRKNIFIAPDSPNTTANETPGPLNSTTSES